MADISSGSEAIGRTFPHRKVWIWAAWLGVALLLWIFLKDVPLLDAWNAIRTVQTWKILVLAAANLLVLFLLGLRWWVILGAFGQRLPIPVILRYRIAGFGVSYFTPGPQIGGEPLQVLLLRRHAVPSSIAVVSVFFDKLIELLVNFLFLLLGLVTALLNGMIPQETGIWVWMTFPLLILLPVVHLFILRRGMYPLTSLLGRLKRMMNWNGFERPAEFVQRGEKLIADFLRDRPADLAGAIIISVFLWFVSILEFWLLFYFLGAQASWVQIISILTAGRLAFLLPVPGGFGTLEASLVIASQAAGLSAVVGLAAGLIIHLRDIVVGLIGLWIAGWSSRSSITG